MASISATADNADESLPKVESINSVQPLSRPKTLQMLSQFLMEEQERRTKLREDHNLNTTWKDLQNAYDILATNLSSPHGSSHHHYGTGGPGGGGGLSMGFNSNDTLDASGVGDWSKRLAHAAASGVRGATNVSSTFMGSPEQQSILKDKKTKKDRKKKKKDAKKEAKRQAKLQAKMMMGGNNNRF